MRKLLDQHDVLFSVGADLFTLSLPSDVEPVPPDLRIIHLDADPWELGKNFPAEVAILGDPKGHAARTDRGHPRQHVERRAERRAGSPQERKRSEQAPSSRSCKRARRRSRAKRRCSRSR